MTNTITFVFSNPKYVALSFAIFVPMLFGLLILSEYVFLEPYVVSHLPTGTEFGFALIVIISALSALVLPMNVFRINVLKSSTRKMGGSVIGSFVGAAAGACSCGPIGFAVISTFGSVGATATAFLTNYEIPLRLIAIGVLVITYFTTVKSLKTECKFDP
ncbi:hypothetical protein [Nitrosopumilus sp.]|uniref:hypothetical protein n=1 Tax=Nitrosopumilus sp. TaxID=2024843 RepID=UPI003D12969E